MAVMMITLFASPSTAWAHSNDPGNGQVVATVQSTGQGNPVEYTDLEAAFKAAKKNDEITLQANCTLAADEDKGLLGKIIVGNGTDEIDVKLDLNSHTISGSADGLVTIATNARLRITDGGTGGSIATTGEKAIVNAGVLDMLGGSVSSKTCGIYSQGTANIGGGMVSSGTDSNGDKVSGDTYGLYVEQGMANISGGTFVASGTDGIGIESENANGFYLLGLPTFNCTVADISLAQDQKIEFSGDIGSLPNSKRPFT